MEFFISKDQLFSFYFLVGEGRFFTMWGLFVLSFLLTCLGLSSERNKQLVTIPCILCALLSFIVFYAYFMEIVVVFQSGAKFEMEAFKLRWMGPYWYAMVIEYLAVTAPVLLLFSFFRKTPWRIMMLTLCGLLSIHFEDVVILISTRGYTTP